MPVSVNLSRNTKVYFTTQLQDTGFGDHNTVEIQVLNGYTFSQGTDQQTIQINEAGATPNRGQRSFNTKLNPVDWKFSTYVRPYYKAAAATTLTVTAATAVTYTTNGIITNAEVYATTSAGTWNVTNVNSYTITGMSNAYCNSAVPIPVHRVGATPTVKWSISISGITAGAQAGTGIIVHRQTNSAPESCLWNALVSNGNLFAASATALPWYAGTAAGTASGAPAKLVATSSNVHTLAPFALIFKVDNIYYKVNGCALNMAELNFGIDQIAQIAWSGFGTAYSTFTAGTTLDTEILALRAFDSTPGFITNKLSVASLGLSLGGAYSAVNGAVTNVTTYSVPITGGLVSINNNLTYLTPEVIGVVNSPIGYFTGTRSVTGNLTAYLRTGGTTETSDLLQAIVTGAGTAADNKYSMILNMGGTTVYPHIEVQFDGAMLQVPSVDVQDVVSTTINFTAQSTAPPNYDLTAANEFQLRYLGA